MKLEVFNLKRNMFVFLLVIILLSVAIYQNVHKNENQETVIEQVAREKFSAPHFELASLDGQQYEVMGKRDKPLLINFWASWCGPCEDEAPDLARLYNTYKDKFDLYAVNITQEDNLDQVQEFVKRHQYDFPVLMDEEGSVSELYDVIAIPTSYLIDRNGVIIDKFSVLSYKGLEQKIVQAIENQP